MRDSKKIPELKRELLEKEIKSLTDKWAVVLVSPKYIDQFNINQAIFYAIQKGLKKLSLPNPFLFVDGNYKLPSIPYISGYQSIIKGDDQVPSISAASILAKVTRDRFMVALDSKAPGYSFSENKGYGTEKHRIAILSQGISRSHRLSFLNNFREDRNEPSLFPEVHKSSPSELQN